MAVVILLWRCKNCDSLWTGRPSFVALHYCARCDAHFQTEDQVTGEGSSTGSAACPTCHSFCGRIGNGCPDCRAGIIEQEEVRECQMCGLLVVGEEELYRIHLETHVGMEYD